MAEVSARNYHQNWWDQQANSSDLPITFYIGTDTPPFSFTGTRSYGAGWGSTIVEGNPQYWPGPAYRYEKTYVDLYPGRLQQDTYHFVRCEGRATINGDLDSVDWPTGEAGGIEPDDWCSYYHVLNFWLKIRWE